MTEIRTQTPAARLLESDHIEHSMKERLRGVAVTVDPLRLLDEIRAVQQHLANLATGAVTSTLPGREVDLDRFLRSLASAWQGGEVRPTHQVKPKPARSWRTRPDPFEHVWPRIRAWLDEEPDRTAKDLFQQLQDAYPNQFPAGQLRTLQRRVRTWRAEAAQRLVFGGNSAHTSPSAPSRA